MTIDEKINAATEEIGRRFRCFGHGAHIDEANPIAQWTKDQPLVFALGVDVREVVAFVLEHFGQSDTELLILLHRARKAVAYVDHPCDVPECIEAKAVVAAIDEELGK